MEKFTLAIIWVLVFIQVPIAYGVYLSYLTWRGESDDALYDAVNGPGPHYRRVGYFHMAILAYPFILMACMTGVFQLKSKGSGLKVVQGFLALLGYVTIALITYYKLEFGN